jgi:hypothetical protein
MKSVVEASASISLQRRVFSFGYFRDEAARIYDSKLVVGFLSAFRFRK